LIEEARNLSAIFDPLYKDSTGCSDQWDVCTMLDDGDTKKGR